MCACRLKCVTMCVCLTVRRLSCVAVVTAVRVHLFAARVQAPFTVTVTQTAAIKSLNALARELPPGAFLDLPGRRVAFPASELQFCGPVRDWGEEGCKALASVHPHPLLHCHACTRPMRTSAVWARGRGTCGDCRVHH
jgi:hypothetical protein